MAVTTIQPVTHRSPNGRVVVPPHERTLRRVVQNDVPFRGEPCWIFTGSINPSTGYGNIGTGFVGDGTKKNKTTHRVMHEAFIGPVPKGLEIDHLCRVRSCCNPAHLEAVTHSENARRGLTGFERGRQQRAKTHCDHGHEYTPENTYVRGNGSRMCRTCVLARDARKRQAKKEAV